MTVFPFLVLFQQPPLLIWHLPRPEAAKGMPISIVAWLEKLGSNLDLMRKDGKCESITFTVAIPITYKLYTIDNRALTNTTTEGILQNKSKQIINVYSVVNNDE